ncbi:PAS domain-containing protein [Microbulbifer salipaludis]|uniref:HTH-type transcriptional regulatory protein TyrR n=1 Tax=Microbulbifer salipaludis TaxID=187980 RepID=A0ABS3E7Y4_9GAMM|nr:TyrR/PhhR family helix-turn-helix DNA-binding protein [Microbulbifer salipaludis]MBN8431412.1 PAS domain-containing protein [Microbulbifer salipaludis]
MSIFSDYRVNVRSGEIGGDSGDKVYLSAPGLLVAQYQSIEKSLHRVRGVRQVRRIELIPSERRHFELDTLLRHVKDPVLSVDREGRIVAANQAAARAFGISHSQVAGMSLQRFLPRLQLAELLRGITAPRYGFPVTVRGQAFTLDWSPIALAEAPGAVASLAGAVLTLQPREGAQELAVPLPQVLWDLDKRRESCLRLQQMAPLREPLLICGERGTGKSTFMRAAYYLSPLAEQGQVRVFSGAVFGEPQLAEVKGLFSDTMVLLDDADTVAMRVQQALAEALLKGSIRARLVLSAHALETLAVPLQQLLEPQCVYLPPLRAMRPALGGFAEKLLENTAAELSASAREALMLRDWPTNLSGLSDCLMAAAAHTAARGAPVVELADLPSVNAREILPWQEWGRGLTLKQQMEKVERSILQEQLASHSGGSHSTRDLAGRLGISHTAIANKLRKYGLVPEASGD